MNPLVSLDRAILGIHQRIADWVQYRSQRTCFWLARIAALAFIIPMMINCFAMAAIRPKMAHQWTFVAIGMFLVYGVVLLVIVGIEQLHRTRHRNGFEAFWWSRMMFVTFLAWCFFQDMTLRIVNPMDICMIALAVALYFAACTPLPPGSKQPERAAAPPKLIEA